MTIKYNSQYVDEKYLPMVEPNLYADTVIIPGVTCTDKYVTGPAGQIYVHKLAKGSVEVGKPGRDFTDEESNDELVQIAINNNFQKSNKIFGVMANAVAIPLAEENLAGALNVVSEARQYSAIACLANEGTASADTTAVTAGGETEALLALRKAIKDAHGKADFALVSTEIYKGLLKEVGLTFNGYDEATKSAELLKRFGLTIIECNSFDETSAKYFDYTGTEKTVDLSGVEMIVGSHEAFAVVPNLEALRIKDSERFVGSLAQVEMNVGFRVTNAGCVVVKKNK